MEYLARRVSDHTIDIPYVITKLKTRVIPEGDLEKMKDFIMLYEFERDNLDVTETWENLGEKFGETPYYIWVFFNHEEEMQRRRSSSSNMTYGIGFRGFLYMPEMKMDRHGDRKVQNFLLDCKHDIHKVYLPIQNSNKYHNDNIHKIRELIMRDG